MNGSCLRDLGPEGFLSPWHLASATPLAPPSFPSAAHGPTPTVSVLVSNHDYARFLPAALDSVLAQSWPASEVIVVDDGSTDGSQGILERYRDRVTVIEQANHGQASAINAAFRRSTGSLVCLLDADDVWLSTKLETMVRLAGRFPGATCLYHRIQRVDEGGRRMGGPRPRGLWTGDIRRVVAHTAGAWAPAPTSGLCFPRSFLDRVLPIPERDYAIAADAFLYGLAPFLGPVAASPTVLGLYRLHSANGWNHPAARRGETAWLERAVSQAERHVGAMNRALADLGLPHRLDVSDDFLYQRQLRQLGRPKASVARLAGMILRRPLEPSLRWRLAAGAGMLLEAVRRPTEGMG